MSKSQRWLEENKALRMDANNELFDQARREFHIGRYEFAKQFCLNKKVLDGACGTGYGSAILSKVAESVVGIDCDGNAIIYATEVYKADNNSFKHSYVELTDIPDSSFDVVVSFETVEHTLCPESHLREITRLLKEDGIAILSVPNNWGLTDHHFWDFNFTMLEKLTSNYFLNVEYYYNNSTRYGENAGISAYKPNLPAECIIAICSGVKKFPSNSNRYSLIMDEIYKGVFSRHHGNIRKKSYYQILKNNIRNIIRI